MGNVIFDDLEIDFSTMLTEPEAFSKSVTEKAEELKEILRGNSSISAHISAAPAYAGDFKEYDQMLLDIWGKANEELPIAAYKELAKKLRKMADQVEYLATDKAAQELAEKIHVMDKQTAHAQYKRLAEAYNQWVEAVKLFDMGDFEKLKPMSGNFGGNVALVRYMFFFEGEDEGYRNHLAVCRKIGIELRNLMDTIEYIEAHPELNITVKQLTS